VKPIRRQIQKANDMTQPQAPSYPPVRLPVTRRSVLLALAAQVPAIGLGLPSIANAADADDPFLKASRVIAGNATLSAGVARRIAALLGSRIADFGAKLDDLAKTLEATGGTREQMLSALSAAQVRFALAIAEPWYLGRVGKPSDFVLKDDAVFATYLEAQSWSKIVDEVPRPTYPGGNAGWWDAAPPGVQAPAMPAGITQWTFHPGGPTQIMAPDPKWKAYATAPHADMAAARRAKPGRT
jgi:hypothetical protein